MDFIAIRDSFELPVAFQRHLGGLIEVVGKREFGLSLFEVLREMTGCEQLIVFKHERGNAPQTLLSEQTGVVSDFDRRNSRYESHFWRMDPVHHLTESSTEGDCYLARINARDIVNRSYRKECFTEVGLGSRASIVRTGPNQIMRVNLYLPGQRALDTSLAERISSVSWVVDSLLRRHARDFSDVPQRPDSAYICERVRAAAPALTQRELEVCTQIVRGLTSEGIALELGISHNTVLTYRKRAYARLNITSQNDLMHMVMS